MKKHNPQIFFKTIVTIFLTGYLVGSFANMLWIPRYVPDVSKISVAGAPVVRLTRNINLNNTNYIQVFDRSTVDNDVINELTFAPKSFDLGFRFDNLPVELNTIPPPQNHPYNNFQYSYLSFCTFRI